MKFQLTLSNILLLTTVIALSILLWLQSSRNKAYENQLPALRNAARELVVTDPGLLHAVESHPEWDGEKIWRIHVPKNGDFQLNLLTENIPSAYHSPRVAIKAVPEHSLKLAPGSHKVELVQRKGDADEIEILIDDNSVLSLEKKDDWHPKNVGATLRSDVDTCQSHAAGEEVQLINLKFKASNPNLGRAEQHNGILLWISSDETK